MGVHSAMQELQARMSSKIESKNTFFQLTKNENATSLNRSKDMFYSTKKNEISKPFSKKIKQLKNGLYGSRKGRL